MLLRHLRVWVAILVSLVLLWLLILTCSLYKALNQRCRLVKLGQVGQVLAATTSVFRQLLQHIVIVIVILILLLVLRYRIEALERRLARASAR